jgi:hypothetical protein
MDKPIDRIKPQEVRLRRTRFVTVKDREQALDRLATRAEKGQFDEILSKHERHRNQGG